MAETENNNGTLSINQLQVKDKTNPDQTDQKPAFVSTKFDAEVYKGLIDEGKFE